MSHRLFIFHSFKLSSAILIIWTEEKPVFDRIRHKPGCVAKNRKQRDIMCVDRVTL